MSLTTPQSASELKLEENHPGSVHCACAPVCNDLQPAPRSVLLLVDQLTELGGGERVLFDLARTLPRYGYQATVVTFRDHPDPATYQLCNSITILPFSSCFSLEAIRVARRLRAIIRARNVQIVQTFFETSDTYGALVARLAGVSRIISSRRDMGLLRAAKHNAAYRLLAPLYSRVLAVSEGVRQSHMASDHLRQDRVQTIHNGLDLTRFSNRDSRGTTRHALGLLPGTPLVTTVANINPWKGLDVFLRAAASVHKACPEAIFAIAGDWTDRPLVAQLQELAHTLGIAAQVRFLGRVNDVPSLLIASDLFVLLSRSEGFPNVVLEAMAARLPVIATRVGGTPEAVLDGTTGWLVENGDASAAAIRILALLGDPARLISMGKAGQHRAATEFSLDRMTRKHVELYDALLDSDT